MKIPYIPEDAPFNEDQRAWLNGFWAGFNSSIIMTGQVGDAPGQTTKIVNILYGTQTGNAEILANEAADAAKGAGMTPVVESLEDVDLERFAAMERVIIVTSTYGEGEMPDNAQLFWEALTATTAPRMESMNYAVLAIGDTAYDEFCEAGKLFDIRLEQLGANRVAPRIDCDVDYEDPAAAWIEENLPKMIEFGSDDGPADGAQLATTGGSAEKSKWTRKNPYTSVVSTNRLLSGEGSAKEIRHFEFELGDSDIKYEAGDALGVMPVNNPELVSDILGRLNLSADAAVSGQDAALGTLLTNGFEISMPSKDLIRAIEERAGNDELSHIVTHGDKEAMDNFLWSKDSLDLLNLNPEVSFTADEFVGLLKPLQHRAYSISSSSLRNPDQIHLTIASVRYHSHGRDHGGVCSTFLADLVSEGDTAGIFLSPNKAFRVPEDNDVPMIMVGPGTGIAPFRAFLHERQERGAKGKNWLLFGDQHRSCDYIYEDEIEEMATAGVLHKLDLAFSRDQAEKVYVQTRMKESGADLYAWLEEGGYFYICGDATRMAKDVDKALHDIVMEHGGRSEEQAVEYVNAMKKEKRYLRDVY
ncbi:MAG: sulfite reductase subunit alpha [Methyloligellaceae bacterium]